MQTTKIRIKNLFGLTDLSLDGSSVRTTDDDVLEVAVL